jgi:hypothetical protein
MNDTVPNTVFYMLLGYAVFFGSLGFYVLSWFMRRRNLEKDIELLTSLQEETKSAPPADVVAKPVTAGTR